MRIFINIDVLTQDQRDIFRFKATCYMQRALSSLKNQFLFGNPHLASIHIFFIVINV